MGRALRARAGGTCRARGAATRAMRAVGTGASRAPDTRGVAAPTATNEERAIRTLRAIALHGYKIAASIAKDAFNVATIRPEVATEHTTTEVALRLGRASLARQDRNH
jgi:hypothetical protein